MRFFIVVTAVQGILFYSVQILCFRSLQNTMMMMLYYIMLFAEHNDSCNLYSFIIQVMNPRNSAKSQQAPIPSPAPVVKDSYRNANCCAVCASVRIILLYAGTQKKQHCFFCSRASSLSFGPVFERHQGEVGPLYIYYTSSSLFPLGMLRDVVVKSGERCVTTHRIRVVYWTL